MLLAALSRDQYARLAPHMNVITYAQHTELLNPEQNFEHVYFPHNGMLSLLAVMRDGKAIETATVGREGVVGGMAGLGVYRSLVRVTVQLPSTVSRIPAVKFRKLVGRSDELRDMCVHFNEALLTQARVTAACNALHAIEARLCRWLLQSADRAGDSTVHLTQELLAEMLGVRRPSVTEVARKMQAEGIITYSRGVITILDRARLERISCECYQTLVEHTGKPT